MTIRRVLAPSRVCELGKVLENPLEWVEHSEGKGGISVTDQR